MLLIEALSKRVDTHDAVIADLVRSIRAIVEGAGKPKSRSKKLLIRWLERTPPLTGICRGKKISALSPFASKW